MTLLQGLRNLRTDPLIMAWVEDGDVMWLPQYLNGRIRIPFYTMKKEEDNFLFAIPGIFIEVSWPQLRLVKMERGDGRQGEGVAFAVSGRDSFKCRELFLEYYEEMEQYLRRRDDAALTNLKRCEQEIENLLRRI